MIEEYRDIAGYEGLYKVSNLGNVYSLISKRLLKQHDQGSGKIQVTLTSEPNISRVYYVSRLVAIAFIPNVHNYPIVHHKDENPSNNEAINLEWTTHSLNTKYSMSKYTHKLYKAVKCVELNKVFISCKEAKKYIGYKGHGKLIGSSIGGYTWKLVKEVTTCR